jgi:hypothetical protein
VGRRRGEGGRVSGRLLAVAVVVVVLVAGYAAAARLGPRPTPAGWAPPSDLAEYTAVVHVHSGYSHDGRGSVEEIAAAAARAGVRVVLLTDHNTLAPLHEGKEGWYGPALVLVGAEITTGSGYLLLFDPRPDLPVRARGFALDDLLARYREAGALVLLAHPDHPRLGWRGDWPPVDGVEVVDVFDQVVAAPVPRQLMGFLAYPVNPVMAVLSVVHWPRPVLAQWDRIARERPTIGVLALDAHGGIEVTDETAVPFPSHETAFRIGQIHFVTRDPLALDKSDRIRVYRAMRAGQFYNAFDGLAPAAGFRFEARRDGEVALMGETLEGPGWTLEVRVPPVGDTVVRVLRDGAVVHEAPGRQGVRVPVSTAGAYRVEVDLAVNLFPISTVRRMPWIFSNAIHAR